MPNLDERRFDLMRESLTWLGTPWKHNQCVKGKEGGVDCIRFLEAIAKIAGIPLSPIPSRYRRNLIDDSICEYLDNNFKPTTLDRVVLGDILVFQWGDIGHHVGVISRTNKGCTMFIHASLQHKKVLEQILDTEYLNRVVAVYQLVEDK